MSRRRRNASISRRLGTFLTLTIIVLVLVSGWFALTQLRGPDLVNASTVKIVFYQNQSLRQIADTLETRSIIRSATLFRLLSRLTGRDRNIRTGRYSFPAHLSEYQALRLISQGGEKNAFVTIPEGFTTEQIAARLQSNGVCDRSAFLAACRDTSFLHAIGITLNTAEGFLFPDSYYFEYGLSARDLVTVMYRRFLAVVNSLTADPLVFTPDRVILASLVEAEAAQDSERPIVASVFLNRLRRRMPLQSCATVEYVLPERKAMLTDADTRVESPYNTYLHVGLPPGPICNPGKASLRAALNPARTDYLFFVARGNGCHYFTTSYSEHLAAQRRSRQN